MVRIAPFATWVQPRVPPRRRDAIDLAHLDRQTLGDIGLREEVLRVYDSIQRTYFARVRGCKTPRQMTHHLQLLKAAAAGVGAAGLVTLAEGIEFDIASGKPIEPERIDDLGFAIEEVSLFIAVLLGEVDTIN